MGWRAADYNLNLLHKKTDYAINKRFKELQARVRRDVQTFERHGVNPRHVQNIKAVLDAPNQTRREKEKAIMELRRFTLLETSTYTKYAVAQREARETWKDIGIGANYSTKQWREFFNFLEWVKSMTGSRYELNSVKEAWEKSVRKDKRYSALETRTSRAMETWQKLKNDHL